MDSSPWENFLQSLTKEFKRYKNLGDRCMDQLSWEEMLYRNHEEENSIALIVKHITGNIQSRFTDFLTEDGEKPWRNRDSEFLDPYKNMSDLLNSWEDSWELLFNTLDAISSEDWHRKVYIRREPHTLMEAFMRQLGHYAYHVGQIVYMGKQIKGASWQNLSIPKGGSEAFNSKYF